MKLTLITLASLIVSCADLTTSEDDIYFAKAMIELQEINPSDEELLNGSEEINKWKSNKNEKVCLEVLKRYSALRR